MIHKPHLTRQEQVENELDKLEKHGVIKKNNKSCWACGDKMLITLLEFAETIRQLSMSLNDEMMYEINHQVSYDPRSYACNLCNCVSRSLEKSGLQLGFNLRPSDTGAML